MKERREKRKRWVRRGRYAVEVEVEVIYPAEDPSEPCLEPATVRWLDEVARRAEKGDLAYLRSVGEVFRAVPTRNDFQKGAERAIVRNCRSVTCSCSTYRSGAPRFPCQPGGRCEVATIHLWFAFREST
jgi:hypothetical protein